MLHDRKRPASDYPPVGSVYEVVGDDEVASVTPDGDHRRYDVPNAASPGRQPRDDTHGRAVNGDEVVTGGY